MFIVNNELTAISLPGGLVAWLTPPEYKVAKTYVGNGKTLADAIVTMHEVQSENETEALKRLKATRLAIAGEWGGLRRQLDLWGVEPLR